MATDNNTQTYHLVEEPLEKVELNGVRPFSLSAGDNVEQLLAQAHAILTLMRSAFYASEEEQQRTGHSEFACVREGIKASALDGVASLVALAQHNVHLSYVRSSNRRRTA